MCVCIYMYIYVYIYVCIYVYIHAYIPKCILVDTPHFMSEIWKYLLRIVELVDIK